MGASLGFFEGRPAPDFGIVSPPRAGLLDYVNVPTILGMLISGGMASARELQSVYGLEDAYDLAEILLVDSHNRIAAAKNANHSR